MNDEQKYSIVFTGRFAQDIDRTAVMQNLAALFKTDVASVAQRFSDADTVIKSNVNQTAAGQYINALNNAGALCRSVAEPKAKPPNPTQPRLIDYRLGVGEIGCSPLPINRITQGQGGININRVDIQDVPFQDILLLSVYEHVDLADSKMLLFLRGFKKPFVCDCFKITYSDFFDVKGSTMQDSVRNFAKTLLSKNNRLILDEKTYEFVQGGKLPEFNGDVVRLSTALSAALMEMDLDSEPVTIAPESPAKINLQKQPEEVIEQRIAAETPTKQSQPSLAACPKCGQGYNPSQAECSHCGIIFAKWQAKKEREQQAVLQESQNQDAPVEVDYEWELDEIDLWARQGGNVFAYFLIGAFIIPLLKYSMLFASSVFIWPWNIIGLGVDAQKAAAMATASIPEHLLAWGLLPIIAAIGLLSGSRFMSLRSFTASQFLVGIASLILALVVFHEEAEILGLMFTPPTAEAGVMILLAVVGGALVAATNHLRKRYCEVKSLRVLSGIGGGIMVALMALQMLAADGGWAGWSMMLLYALMIACGMLGLFSAFRPEPEDQLLQRISLVARVILWWAPVACLIAQNWLNDPYTNFVTSGGGGFINISIAVIKGFLMYYGFSFLMAIGFTAYLEQSLLKSQALDQAV
ncbi:MAG: hypothetical protein ACU83U_01470 [Gammaproteobacteria bacterium]